MKIKPAEKRVYFGAVDKERGMRSDDVDDAGLKVAVGKGFRGEIKRKSPESLRDFIIFCTKK